jgi:hypothetical protein
MNNEKKQEVQLKYRDEPDVSENLILDADEDLLMILLKDQTTKKNILWMTDNYTKKGKGYEETSEITIPLITGKNAKIIRPRVNKNKAEQLHRVKSKAEVFTPSWICNRQNNLIDDTWFGRKGVFNIEVDRTWLPTAEKISFPEEKIWKNYVLAQRLEIACGEAPYLVSRYDTTTGKMLDVKERIGMLDRKLRIVNENTATEEEWIQWSIKAVQSIYGFECQGDSLLLARENIVLSYIDHFKAMSSDKLPTVELVREIAQIASWNLWQMDGLKFVVPHSCYEHIEVEEDLFEVVTETRTRCEGCSKDNITKHNGIFCRIKDWQENKVIKAVDLLKGDGE